MYGIYIGYYMRIGCIDTRELFNAWCILIIIMAGSEVLKCDCEVTEVID